MVLVVALFSPDGRYDELFLSNYVTTQINDVLARVDGVGRGDDLRCQGLRHADLARSESARGPWPDHRRGPRRRCASRTFRWRPARSASSRTRGPQLRVLDLDPGTPELGRAVRADHRQDRRARPAGAHERHRAGRARGPDLRLVRRARWRPGDHAGHLPASRVERSRRRPGHPGRHGDLAESVPRGARVVDALRRDALHHASIQSVITSCCRPSCWSF